MDEALRLARRLSRVVHDPRVLGAVASVPRERFIGPRERSRAYENVALPIDCDQTISQPVVVARMLELLELDAGDRVLDVGTGSGYHAALLSLLAAEVWTIERHPELSVTARATLAELGYANVICVVGDGWRGLAEQAPFDAINVAAATGPRLPEALEHQLADGGRLVAPVGADRQFLTRVRRTQQGLVRERLDPVRFVPLVRDPDGPQRSDPERGDGG
ncbi:MAG: protein-L-isoaspartate(D-aspartate) O-methyltransferase [Solirubrobacteraceae bacterium]